MEIIAHRRNTSDLLASTPTSQGVEVDIRTEGGRLIIHHDPFATGEDFERWIEGYRHGLLILNVKEEGLEDALLALMAKAGIARFFFLDQSFPFLIRTARTGERRCAVRVSEYESVDTALALAGKVDWVWLDCFTDALPDPGISRVLQEAGFKICLVSPELQGRRGEDEIPRIRAHAASNYIEFDAVCTKAPALWT
jgi:hypothetical protein